MSAALTICSFLLIGGLNVDGEADSWDFGVGMQDKAYRISLLVQFSIDISLYRYPIHLHLKPVHLGNKHLQGPSL